MDPPKVLVEEGRGSERSHRVPEREKLPQARVGHALVVGRRMEVRRLSVDAGDAGEPIDEDRVMQR